MAARRILIALLAFIGGISIVAALVPIDPPTGGQDETTSTTSTTDGGDRQAASPRPEPDGEFIRETVRPTSNGKPARIEAEQGDQLSLLVYSRAGEEVELTRTGVSDFADRLAPARFDVRLDETGIYQVRPLGGGEPLATIRVSDPKDAGSGRNRAEDSNGPPSQSADGPMEPDLETS